MTNILDGAHHKIWKNIAKLKSVPQNNDVLLLSLIKKFPVFQNLTGSLYARIPAFAEHNIAKYQALKKAFYLTALEKLEGDYLEFGVFTGSSFVFSVKAHRSLQGLAKLPTRFFGFDSFAGFGPVGENENTPSTQTTIFRLMLLGSPKISKNRQKEQRQD